MAPLTRGYTRLHAQSRQYTPKHGLTQKVTHRVSLIPPYTVQSPRPIGVLNTKIQKTRLVTITRIHTKSRQDTEIHAATLRSQNQQTAMNEVIRRAIRSLSESTDARRPSASIRDYIEDIDAAISTGVKIEAIQETLLNLGFEIGPHALRGLLYRYRKERKEKGIPPPNRAATEKPLASVPSVPTKKKDRMKEPQPTQGNEDPKAQSDPFAYRSQLSPEEKEHLMSLSPTEKIDYFRQQAQRRKFTHNPTPERFRKEGE